MTLRARLAVGAAVAVAVAVAFAAAAAYAAIDRELRAEVDRTLEERARSIAARPAAILGRDGRGGLPGPRGTGASDRAVATDPQDDELPDLDIPPPQLGEAGGLTQVVTARGRVRTSPGDVELPVDERTLAVAQGDASPFFATTDVDGTPVRVYTAPLGNGVAALQVARPLTEQERVLDRLGLLFVGIAGIGAAGAAIAGWFVARTALRPVRRLTQAAEEITETQDLTRRIDVHGRDEVARLADRFNRMLAALDATMAAQRRFVADASHELRTPITSLRTNIEVLMRQADLPADDRERLLHDVERQTAELGELVASLLDLERAGEPIVAEPVALDELVARAVDSAAFHWPEVRFKTDLTPTTVLGAPDRLHRAVANLLDNAGKWSPPGASVEVTVRGGEVRIRDHGPGIAPEDRAHVFERFWRAPGARAVPGSGLGLPIVAEIARAHDGEVRLDPAPGGGIEAVLTLSAHPAGGTAAVRTPGGIHAKS